MRALRDPVTLGSSGLQSSRQGLGCMGMSEFYGAPDDSQSLAVLNRAVELGINHFDTSDLYGRGDNERLLAKLIASQPRDDLLIASKFGILRDPDGPPGSTYDRTLDSSPDYMRSACEASLRRLGVDRIDLYYLHRHDPAVPIEEIVGAMGELVHAGKIRGIGLSEVTPDVLRRAYATAPIAALQSEYSLFCREVELAILPACRELGIAFLPYSPLGRGILTGGITTTSALPDNDLRRISPRFAEDALARDLKHLETVRDIAAGRGASVGQIALAWLHHQGGDIVPIPGTKRQRYLEENVGAIDVPLSDEDMTRLDALAPYDPASAPARWSTVATGAAR